MASSVDLKPSYTYSAIVEHWADGDTVDLVVDLGFKLTTRQRFRVWGIDTPERTQPNHDEAWALAKSLAPIGSGVTIQVFKAQEKWGRYLCVIVNNHGVDVGQEIVAQKLAVPYFGGTKGVSA